MTTLVRDFARCRRGGIIPIAAAAIPMLALLVIAATELAAVHVDKGRLQDTADAVALEGANQLTVAAEAGIVARAEASARKQLADLATRSTALEAEAEIVNKGTGVHVALTSRRTSFFGNMLPPGGFVTRAESTATRMRVAPLCVLAHASVPNTIHLSGSSALSAPLCLVHSNKEIGADESSRLSATLVQAVGSASGNIAPQAEVGAERIEDPFASLPITFPTSRCLAPPQFSLLHASVSLPPGRYCGPVRVGLGQTLTLGAGNYYFMGPQVRGNGSGGKGKGKTPSPATVSDPSMTPTTAGGLVLSGNAVLRGTGATLFFDKESTFQSQDLARVNLAGATTGVWAGFLIVAARDNVNDFVIKADNVENLLGTVYIPSAKLLIDGVSPVAANSEWTIVVAKEVEIRGSATLVINAKFARSTVPVPAKYREKFDRQSVRLLD